MNQRKRIFYIPNNSKIKPFLSTNLSYGNPLNSVTREVRNRNNRLMILNRSKQRKEKEDLKDIE
jgi:hypothetical protein